MEGLTAKSMAKLFGAALQQQAQTQCVFKLIAVAACSNLLYLEVERSATILVILTHFESENGFNVKVLGSDVNYFSWHMNWNFINLQQYKQARTLLLLQYPYDHWCCTNRGVQLLCVWIQEIWNVCPSLNVTQVWKNYVWACLFLSSLSSIFDADSSSLMCSTTKYQKSKRF